MLLWVLGCVEYGFGDPDETAVPDVVVTETFHQAALPALDVLFVVDSTGSMSEEQAGLGAAAPAFLDGLAGLEVDYQVGVTTTDPKDAGALQGRPWIITPSTPEPAAALATALAVGVASMPPSAGLDAAAMALEDSSGLNRGFRRADAALHVVFISDADDGSGAWLGTDPVGAFLDHLEGEAARSGHLAVASAVVGDVPGGCTGVGGSALPGTDYAEVADASGGRVVSICTTDYTDVVDAIGALGVEWQTVFPLQEAPAADSVTVTVDGTRQDGGWSVDDTPALVFTTPPPAEAVITVRYTLPGGS